MAVRATCHTSICATRELVIGFSYRLITACVESQVGSVLWKELALLLVNFVIAVRLGIVVNVVIVHIFSVIATS
jgi:hypothetical protein